jgi:hypothetical protein
MAQKIDFTSGRWKHCDDTYEVTGYNERKRIIHMTKSTRYGIYFDEIRVVGINRKLSKDKTIKLANHILDLSKMPGLENA